MVKQETLTQEPQNSLQVSIPNLKEIEEIVASLPGSTASLEDDLEDDSLEEDSLENSEVLSTLKSHLFWSQGKTPVVISSALARKINLLLLHLPHVKAKLTEEGQKDAAAYQIKKADTKERHLLISHLFSSNFPERFTDTFKKVMVKIMLYFPHIRGMKLLSRHTPEEMCEGLRLFCSHLHSPDAPPISEEFKQEITDYLTVLSKIENIFLKEKNPLKKEIAGKLIPHLFLEQPPLPLASKLEFAELLANWDQVIEIAEKKEAELAKSKEAKTVVPLSKVALFTHSVKGLITKLWSSMQNFGVKLLNFRQGKKEEVLVEELSPISTTESMSSRQMRVFTQVGCILAENATEIQPVCSEQCSNDLAKSAERHNVPDRLVSSGMPIDSNPAILVNQRNLVSSAYVTQDATAILHNNQHFSPLFLVLLTASVTAASTLYVTGQDPIIFMSALLSTQPDPAATLASPIIENTATMGSEVGPTK